MRHGICSLVKTNGDKFVGQFFDDQEYELIPQDDLDEQENKLLKELKTKGLYIDSTFYITNQIPELNEDFLPYSINEQKKNSKNVTYANMSKKNNIKSHYNELNDLYNFINTGGEFNKVLKVEEFSADYNLENDSVKEYSLQDGSKFIGEIHEGLFQGFGQLS